MMKKAASVGARPQVEGLQPNSPPAAKPPAPVTQAPSPAG
jgi:hypothetical protein